MIVVGVEHIFNYIVSSKIGGYSSLLKSQKVSVIFLAMYYLYVFLISKLLKWSFIEHKKPFHLIPNHRKLYKILMVFQVKKRFCSEHLLYMKN